MNPYYSGAWFVIIVGGSIMGYVHEGWAGVGKILGTLVIGLLFIGVFAWCIIKSNEWEDRHR